MKSLSEIREDLTKSIKSVPPSFDDYIVDVSVNRFKNFAEGLIQLIDAIEELQQDKAEAKRDTGGTS